MNFLTQTFAALAVKENAFRAELAAAAMAMSASRFARPSKHSIEPFFGKVKVGQHSSLKKLMRGAARGKLNTILLDRINLAKRVAADRATVYKNASATIH